jgi:curli production assembly/transport component CsgE
MTRIFIHILFSGILLIAGYGGFAQQPDTTKTNAGNNKEKVPPALRELVEQYRDKVKKDSIMSQSSGGGEEGPTLNNLVMDNTLSKVGHDFYEFFYEKWDPPDTERHFTIYINEKPAPGMGNLVQVKINYDKVFRSKLTPRQQTLERIATQAVKKSTNYIANYKKIKQQLGKDLKGTGIY